MIHCSCCGADYDPPADKYGSIIIPVKCPDCEHDYTQEQEDYRSYSVEMINYEAQERATKCNPDDLQILLEYGQPLQNNS